jgi:hypothetical protein
MLAKKEMSDEPWTIKRDKINLKAEHLLELALADLRMGWKAWIAEPRSTGMERRALVPLQSSQPLDSRR